MPDGHHCWLGDARHRPIQMAGHGWRRNLSFWFRTHATAEGPVEQHRRTVYPACHLGHRKWHHPYVPAGAATDRGVAFPDAAGPVPDSDYVIPRLQRGFRYRRRDLYEYIATFAVGISRKKCNPRLGRSVV